LTELEKVTEVITVMQAKLEAFKPLLKKNFHVKRIGIFGSYVRGEQSKRSDIDILVELEKGHKDFFNFIRLKHYLEDLLGVKVDLVMEKAIKTRLKKRILSEVLYV
jgi:predicted nucleotidyltransferase